MNKNIILMGTLKLFEIEEKLLLSFLLMIFFFSLKLSTLLLFVFYTKLFNYPPLSFRVDI